MRHNFFIVSNKPKFHLARHVLHVSARLDTFDVSSPCILAELVEQHGSTR